jgi:hypothetical protein
MNIKIHPFDKNINMKNYQINPLIQNNFYNFHNVDNVDNIENIKKNIIDKLPAEIVTKIYKEYLEPEQLYIRYKDIIEHPTSMSLNGEYLIAFIPIIFAKLIACKYISTKCKQFNESYIIHKINNKKVFKLMTKGQSFAATILFSLYH